jgi:LAO/AO transport system kinase
VEWEIPVLSAEAQNDVGVIELLAEIRRHRAALEASGALDARRKARRRLELQTLLVDELTAAVERRIRAGDLAAILEQVAEGTVDPYSAAQAILARPDLLTPP